MNEISGRIDEVTELATDWAQNSEPSASQRLTNEITALSERFGSVSTRLIKKEKSLEDILLKWQRFESSCSDLLAWVESQTDVLNESVTVDVSLTLQLQQLATCQVKMELCYLLLKQAYSVTALYLFIYLFILPIVFMSSICLLRRKWFER